MLCFDIPSQRFDLPRIGNIGLQKRLQKRVCHSFNSGKLVWQAQHIVR